MRASRRALITAGVVTTLGTVAGTTFATAAPAGTRTAARPTAATRSMATSAPACRTTNLVIWRGAPGDGVTGGTYHELEFTNVGSAACTLDGYPRVIGVDRGGAQLGRAAGHDAYAAPSAVVLRPGTTAHAVLRISDVGDFSPASCHPTRAVGVKVFPPGRPRGTVVPLRFEACSASGPTYLTVRVVRPRVGVPGVSQ